MLAGLDDALKQNKAEQGEDVMSEKVTIRDRVWLWMYSWHRWRLTRAAQAMYAHAGILEHHYGVKIDQIQIKVRG